MARFLELLEDKNQQLSATNLGYLWCVIVMSIIVFVELFHDKTDMNVLELFCAVCFGGLGIKKFFDRTTPDPAPAQQNIITGAQPNINPAKDQTDGN